MVEHAMRGARLEPYAYPARSYKQMRLFDGVVVNQLVTPYVSRAIDCFSFRHFTLYIRVLSTGEGAHEICFVPEFAVVSLGGWHGYVQGLFAALCYEDTDTAAVVQEAFSGDCDGRYFRMGLVPTAVDGDDYFTVSVWVEFWT